MLLTQEWKIALNRHADPYLLFDVRNDPEEQHNLAGDPATGKICDELRCQILQRVMEAQLA